MVITFVIIVSGKVQGVYYRDSARQKALQLGVTGFVKNLPDGSVMLIATGTKEQLNSLVEWCRQGPPSARVTGVKVMEEEAHPYESFTISR
jgi:acylphosphatase